MIAKIYLVTNLVNGKRYVGFTIRDVALRWKEHCNPSSSVKLLKSAIQKYGQNNFSVEVVYESQDITHTLLVEEERFIRQYNSHAKDGHGYNSNYGGGHNKMGSTPSEITRKRMSEARSSRGNSEEIRAKISSSLKGRAVSSEHRQKLRQANLGKTASDETRRRMSEKHKGKIVTMDTRFRMSQAQKGRVVSEISKDRLKASKRKHCYTLFHTDGRCETGNNLQELSNTCQISRASLSAMLAGKYESMKGWQIRRS